MGRPRKEKSGTQEGAEPQTGRLPGVAQAATQPTAEGKAVHTITIRLDETDKPLPMQRETLERLRAALPHLGLEEITGEEPPHRLLGPKFFDGLCTGVTWTQGMLVERFTGIPSSKAREALRFTKEEKDELREPALAVLDEYLGKLWRRAPDLYAFIFILVAIEMEKFARCTDLMKRKDGAHGGESGGGQ